MSILTDLATAAGGLLVIGGGVGLVVLFGRDPKADEHDLTDYHPRARTADDGPAQPAPVLPGSRAAWPLVDRKPMPARPALRRDVLPPAPPGMDAGSPLWRQLVIEQVVPTLPDAAVRGIADEWLREIAAEQQARSGIRLVVSPADDRDLTGAFPVVRAA